MALIFYSTAAYSCPCQDRTCMAGLELTSFIHNGIEISACFGINDHWSVTGEAIIAYNALSRRKSRAEKEHDAQFHPDQVLTAEPSETCTSALVSYWTSQIFKGPQISLGIKSCSTVEIITEAGYMIPIWNDISISTAIRIPLFESMKNRLINTGCIKICLHYKF